MVVTIKIIVKQAGQVMVAARIGAAVVVLAARNPGSGIAVVVMALLGR